MILRPDSEQFISRSLIRWAGYGLMILSALDFAFEVFPTHFTDQVWEFEMIGFAVEHAPVPLIGMAMVSYDGRYDRRKIEETLLKSLSWFCLLLSILFLLMMPLGSVNVWRIYYDNEVKVASKLAQPLGELETLKSQLNQARTSEEIQQVLTPFQTSPKPLVIQEPTVLKAKLMADLTQKQFQVREQIGAIHASTQQNLLKRWLKWNLGALVCSFFFLRLWAKTRWARNI